MRFPRPGGPKADAPWIAGPRGTPRTGIGMVSGSYPPMRDGVGDYARRLFEELTRQAGAETVFVVTTVCPGSEPDPRVHRIVGKWNLPGVMRAFFLLRRLAPRAVLVEYPAHGYGRHPAIAFLPWLIRLSMPGVKIVMTVHEFPSHSVLQKLRGVFGFLMCHRLAIVVPRYREAIGRWVPWLKRRTVFIPVGATVARHAAGEEVLAALRVRHGLPSDAPVVTYFGVLRPGKGIELLMEAFARFRMAYPSARLLLIGHALDSFRRDRLVPLLGRLRLEEGVLWAGRCAEEEISAYFGLTTMCVLPFTDGFTPRRTSFMAALEHEVPIITTRPIDPFPQMAHGENALLVEPGDAEALARQMVELQGSPALQARLRSNAARLRACFSWPGIARQFLEVLEERPQESAGTRVCASQAPGGPDRSLDGEEEGP